MDVRISDINYGGHVGNDRYLLFFHEARLRYLQNLHLSERDIGRSISLIMLEAHVDYKSQAMVGDVLDIAVRIEELSRVRFTMRYEIRNKDSEELVSHGYTVLAGYDYQKNKVSKLPTSFKEAVAMYEEIIQSKK